MTVAYFVGPWDLDHRLGCVPQDPSAGSIVLVESVAKSRALPYHRKKLVLVLSAMRHFAQELRADGYDVSIVRAPTYVEGIRRHVRAVHATEVVALAPREWALDKALREADLGAPLRLLDDGGSDGHFLLTRDEFIRWAGGKDTLRMDVFYRWMRRRTGLLMEGKKPVGGRWSLDAENRKKVKGERPPALPRYEPDAMTREVMDEVAGWGGGWGEVHGFAWPTTRTDALDALQRFVAERFAKYGDFQDAMVTGEPFLWHACVAPALNLGLLSPGDLLDAAMDAWREGAPLNAVEGIVRQVLGWREFIRGVYWLRMPGLRDANRFGATRPLPAVYWDETRTEMACVRESVGAVREHGYAHHIQRLMVLGNLALLTGVRPLELSDWFWAGFVDAFEWVQLPNVHGMALAADSTFTTKPYAASGAYVNRMSDYCTGCRYNVKKRHGDDACPFNPLFWSFMARHREELSRNPRIAVLYRSWDRWDAEERLAIEATAQRLFDGLEQAETGWRVERDAG
ncbi:MAG: cryptochrome/photolyase family protein [Deltaproteobacteria bacterium]|nr:cryptochrome/photolyase family protein [Deltaproteobacteria bacterium]